MNKTTSLSLIIAAFAIALVIGCGGGGSTNGTPIVRGSGSISVISTFSEATRTVPGYADSLKVTITPPDGVRMPDNMANPFFLTRDITAVVLQDLNASASPYTLNMEALTDGVVVGTAQRIVVVNRDEVHEIDVSANLDSEIAIIRIEGGTFLNAFPGTNVTLESSLFIAFARDFEGNTLFLGEGFIWSSSNTDVLTIDRETGLATRQGEGKTLIRADLIEIPMSSGIFFEVLPRPASRIAYSKIINGVGDIYIMDADGQNQVNLTNSETSDFDPSISRNGKRIVFTSYREEDSRDIFVMDADGLNQARLTHTGATRAPSFSPDGSKIVFSKFDTTIGRRIYIMDSDGQNVQRLTDDANVTFSNPRFSPDGTKITFDSVFGDDSEFADIFIMDADGGNLTNLTPNTDNDQRPSFNANGSTIAFASSRDGNVEIYLMDVDGQNPTRLTINDLLDDKPQFSSDGKKIVYHRVQDNNISVYIMDSDGLLQTQLNSRGDSPSIN